MKSATFHSTEEWNSALLMLPENSFFTLMRSVLGNIKTPFNKQKIIQDLTAFLSRKDIQETIKNYIDKDDHRIIAAIGILEEPLSGELESFFGGEYSYVDLHNIVLNLEERLIVYRFKDEGKSRLALNPILAPILKPLTEKTEILFPSSKLSIEEKTGTKFFSWSDSFLACFISFLYDQNDLFKNQGGIRKKSLDDCKQIFPGLKLEPILGTFRAAGLLQLDESGKHHIDEVRLNQLAELSEYERRIYLAAAMIVFYEQGENFWQFFNRNRILTIAKEIHQFLQNIDPDRCYPKSTLHKMFEVQDTKVKNTFFKSARLKINGHTEFVLTSLQMLCVIEKTKNDFCRIVFKDNSPKEKVISNKIISMDSPASFIVFPEINVIDAIKLARFSSVLETGTTTRFAITKDSVIRAYRIGITCDEIIATLKNLSGTNVDQNIIWQLKDWEKRYAEVALHSGVVLRLSKDRLYLANTEPLASMISTELAPGIFLLNVDEEDEAIRALEKAGVDIIARDNSRSKVFDENKKQLFFPSLDTALKHQSFNSEEKKYHQSDMIKIDEEKSDEQKDHFRTILAKMKITKDQRDELSARIERRLMLTDEQMDESAVRYEKLEARGLDYVGKHNISKQAIAAGALLEVHWSDEQGTIQKIIGIPSSIDKANGEAILVMHLDALHSENENDQGDTIRIVLGKISLLRRIKQSIFGE